MDIVAGGAVGTAYFRDLGGDRGFMPLRSARSRWSEEQLIGPAVAGLLGRAARRVAQGLEPTFLPSRSSVEMFRAARTQHCRVRVETVRHGGRILTLDAFLEQDAGVVARAHVTFVRPGDQPDDEIWSTPDVPAPPPPGTPLDAVGRCFRGEGADWTTDASAVPVPSRVVVWQAAVDVVEGETPAPFDWLTAVSDFASMTTHWSPRGFLFINADVHLAVSRMPAGDGVGFAVLAHTSHAGMSTGTALLFDERGALGTATVTGLAHTHVRIACVPGGGFETLPLRE
ncbi:acyl-CoA thioesterase domain-containing protein [Microbacterium sp. No. 7]|uniref:acyl-CoA thioesterase domain-containing protein n=1 Tax=Microbacterium sp. No. 7 TaxID=1714373 RepID=UPI0006D1E85C|nr:acyl-CoA thioesterase domain-containing protein [Microbacterium sp. No. 7]ALJ19238.1 hypothetical protein AOA12_04710 [Microbacterium sp. No. 7]